MNRFMLKPNLRFRSLVKKINQPPWLILIACILAYGIMIPWLGLYSDDWIYLTSFHKFGTEGLTRYFSTNRPVWGLIYQLTLPILGITPWHWHLFGFFWHSAASLSLWWLLTLIWPKQKQVALWAGLLFAVYPGFVLQPISITFGHIFLVYTAFLLSASFLILAYQRPKNFWLFTFFALFTSAINLLCMEYFLLLHLLQPIVLWYVFQEQISDFRKRLKLVIKAWWPYFLLFLGNLIWRTVFFKYQTNNYQYLFFDRIKNGVGPALIYLVKTMLKDWWNTSIGAWINAFRLPFDLPGSNFDFVYLVISFCAVVFFFYFIYKFSRNLQSEFAEKRDLLQMLALGAMALIIAGGPFWLTELDVSQIGFRSRFSLPFIFGVVLVIGSLLQLLRKPRWLVSLVLALMIGLSIGYQLQIQNGFRREWIVQKNLLWQLAWRIPDLELGTAIFMTEMPASHHITQTILSSMVDWNFHPVSSSQQMDYAVYYPRELLNNLGVSLQSSEYFQYDHLGAVFNGNINQNITIQYSKDDTLLLSCAHVMSPIVDVNNPYLSDEEKKVASLSDPGLITAINVFDSNHLFPEIFGHEPEPTHCYYFEKADLAYQLRRWQLAIDIYNQSTILGESNWIVTELVPVIGSYAYLGDWENAYTYSIKMATNNYYPVSSVLCSLWKVLDIDTPDGLKKQEFVTAISDQFVCQK